jgi:hypothetical protein
MTDRRGSFLICDDLQIALNGKFTIYGVYTSDIVIPADPLHINQLVVVFYVETPITKPFKRLVLQVSVPGESAPRQFDATPTLQMPPSGPPQRTKIAYRLPFLLQSVVLHPGPIEMKVLHEEGELEVGQQWIVTVAQAQAMLMPAGRA